MSEKTIMEAVANAGRWLLEKGLLVGTAGNVSARLPDGNLVVTPSALAYETMTVDDLVVLDPQGQTLRGHRKPTSEKDLHLACLNDHPEVGAVVHSHALYASMFAVTHRPIPCVVEEFQMYVGGDVPVAPYRLSGTPQLGAEVSRHLHHRSAVLLANHGLLTVGSSLEQALAVTELVERTAHIIFGAHSLGNIRDLPQESLDHFAPHYRKFRGCSPDFKADDEPTSKNGSPSGS